MQGSLCWSHRGEAGLASIRDQLSLEASGSTNPHSSGIGSPAGVGDGWPTGYARPSLGPADGGPVGAGFSLASTGTLLLKNPIRLCWPGAIVCLVEPLPTVVIAVVFRRLDGGGPEAPACLVAGGIPGVCDVERVSCFSCFSCISCVEGASGESLPSAGGEAPAGDGALDGASLGLLDDVVNISLIVRLPPNSGNSLAESLSFGRGCECWRLPLIKSPAGLTISRICLSFPSTTIFSFRTPYTGQ